MSEDGHSDGLDTIAVEDVLPSPQHCSGNRKGIGEEELTPDEEPAIEEAIQPGRRWKPCQSR